MKNYKVCVVGGTGLVGSTIIQVMKERKFPVSELVVLASAKSEGAEIDFNGKKIKVKKISKEAFTSDIDIAFFAAGGDVSKEYVPIACEAGIHVVDNSSVFRMDRDVPLIVPEVNGEVIDGTELLISNPNCSTIQVVGPLKALNDRYGLERVIYSTYQAVSGAGMKGISDLKNNTAEKFPYHISETCIPQIDVFLDNGYTKEEQKMIDETRKILGMESLRVTATTVRVPIPNGHAVSINVELKRDFEIEDVRKCLSDFPELVLRDEPGNLVYPLASEASGTDQVYVGRIRRDYSVENGLALYTVADNIRKGAASNTVEIGELLIKKWEE